MRTSIPGRCKSKSILCLLACLSNLAFAEPPIETWGIQALGTLGGRTSQGYSINNAGDAVGQAEITRQAGHDEFHAFIYRNGILADLGVLAGAGGNSIAFGINDSGTVTGSSASTRFATGEVFVWRRGEMVGLGIEGTGFGINNAGDIVGQSYNRAFLFRAGTLTDLGTLGGETSQAYAINDPGQIVGSAATPDRHLHAFLYQDGGMVDLGTLGGSDSAANAINNRGQIVGSSTDRFGGTIAFLYQNGTMQALELPIGDSIATGINNRGDIVGVMGVAQGFLLRDGRLTVLNNLPAVVAAGWQSISPRAISDSGRITGTGVAADGFYHAFIIGPCGDVQKRSQC